jgi:hypothetical protein
VIRLKKKKKHLLDEPSGAKSTAQLGSLVRKVPPSALYVLPMYRIRSLETAPLVSIHENFQSDFQLINYCINSERAYLEIRFELRE